MTSLPNGFPRSGEDSLLLDWWEQQGARGLLILEVKLGLSGPGSWPAPRRHKRLDGLFLPASDRNAIVDWSSVGNEALAELAEGRPAAVLESKDALNTDVIGQTVAGVDMFSRSFPSHGRLDAWATVWAPLDPALAWVASRRGIHIHAPQRPAPDDGVAR